MRKTINVIAILLNVLEIAGWSALAGLSVIELRKSIHEFIGD